MTWLPALVDVEDGLGEVADLWLARTADDLHRVLVLHPPVGESADAYEPMGLLTKHHKSEPASSPRTAILLLTDRRWRGAAGHLVRRIADAGILSDEQLDLLARAFLAADDAIYCPVPDEWFADDPVAITADDSDIDRSDVEGEADDLRGPVVARREIWPPLRRWAAGRQLVREPAAWPMLLSRSAELNARHGAGVMAGMIDQVSALGSAAQALLVERARTSPQQGVRRAAFEFIAARDGNQAAYLLARDDPNAKIRTWAATLVHTPSDDAPPEAPPLF